MILYSMPHTPITYTTYTPSLAPSYLPPFPRPPSPTPVVDTSKPDAPAPISIAV